MSSDSAHNARLTHLDPGGRVRMVDVGDKAVTTRTATASGIFRTTPNVIRLVAEEGLGKADVLPTARLAGIGAAKKTSELIPLCHQISLSSIKLAFDLDAGPGEIRVTGTAKTTGRTGVEMEALTAVSVAGLTLHDMVKAVDPFATMDAVRLESKTGGKRGSWTRERGTDIPEPLGERSAVVLVSSTTVASGRRDGTTGPTIRDWFTDNGFAPVEMHVTNNAQVAEVVSAQVRRAPTVLVTTGGTGVGPDDRTPEATRPHLTLDLPGVAEAMRARGLASTPAATLSRGLVGFADTTLIVNLPGSADGIHDGLAVLDELLEHLLSGHTHGGSHL